MKLSFRQGIVRYQTDVSNNPDFLQVTSSNYVTLSVAPTPTIVTFSQGNADYLFEETQTITNAWGPFNDTSNNYYLYWDIDVNTGLRSFGSTTLAPLSDFSAPTNPAIGQHWYNLTYTTMNVWDGTRWNQVIRVFAGELANGVVLTQYTVGSQVGLNTPSFAGSILFDYHSKPIRTAQLNGLGYFLTTESPFYKNEQVVSTVKFESTLEYVAAFEPIPAFSLVTYKGASELGLASFSSNLLQAIGLVQQDLYIGDVGIITTNGFVSNALWNWTVPLNSPLYCGSTGQITAVMPTTGYIQRIGHVVSSDTIFVDIQQPIHYFDVTNINPTVQIELDLTTGLIVTNPFGGGQGGGGGLQSVYGFTYTQTTPQLNWIINHNNNNTNYLCQIFNTLGELIVPNGVSTVSPNIVQVFFTSPQTGNAQLMFIG